MQSPLTEYQLKAIEHAVDVLNHDGVVAIPTETVYGLAAATRSRKAIEEIFRRKERPLFDPLIVHVASFEQVKIIAGNFPPLLKKVAEKFWPGPLTVLLPKAKDLNPMITSGLETVGVRWPQHAMTEKILLRTGPLAAPSANRFGRTSPTSADHVRKEFGDSVYVVDGGPCLVGVESTVVGTDPTGKELWVFRPGGVSNEDLSQLAPVQIKKSPVAPGHLEHHYEPNLPVVTLRTRQHLDEDLYKKIQKTLSVGVLYPSWLTLPDDARLAARVLYSGLRQAETKPGANAILVVGEPANPNDLWIAIHDRLNKASRLVV